MMSYELSIINTPLTIHHSLNDKELLHNRLAEYLEK